MTPQEMSFQNLLLFGGLTAISIDIQWRWLCIRNSHWKWNPQSKTLCIIPDQYQKSPFQKHLPKNLVTGLLFVLVTSQYLERAPTWSNITFLSISMSHKNPIVTAYIRLDYRVWMTLMEVSLILNKIPTKKCDFIFFEVRAIIWFLRKLCFGCIGLLKLLVWLIYWLHWIFLYKFQHIKPIEPVSTRFEV